MHGRGPSRKETDNSPRQVVPGSQEKGRPPPAGGRYSSYDGASTVRLADISGRGRGEGGGGARSFVPYRISGLARPGSARERGSSAPGRGALPSAGSAAFLPNLASGRRGRRRRARPPAADIASPAPSAAPRVARPAR